MTKYMIGIILGVFVGNWIGVPLFTDKTFTEGFIIAGLASTIVFVIILIITSMLKYLDS